MRNARIGLTLSSAAFCLSLVAIVAAAMPATGLARTKVGVLIGSYGDVDDPSEVRELVVNTVSDPDVVPLPDGVRELIANIGWEMRRCSILDEYAAIGNRTHFRANTAAQAAGVAARLRAWGIDATGYTGFTQTFPYVRKTMEQIQADGVETLIVFYEGAQYSRATSYLVFREVGKYLAKHPDWRVKAIAVRSFSDDPRFRDLLAASINDQIRESFPHSPADDICILLPMHGNIMKWINSGDPSLAQMQAVSADMKARFSPSFVAHGFQNHDEMPFVKWTQPVIDTVLEEVAAEPCTNVVINGRATFTVDSLETLYDHALDEREQIIRLAAKRGVYKDVVVADMFNAEPDFVQFLATLADEALHGDGDIAPITP